MTAVSASEALPKSRSSEVATNADEEHGAIFTKRWVVELILDLAGYTKDKQLWASIALEPACGEGAFLVPMVERLSDACKRDKRDLLDSLGTIRAFDLQPEHVVTSRQGLVDALTGRGWPLSSSTTFAEHTVKPGDFLLYDHGHLEADFVLGNPPYIRLEAVPPTRGEAYRRACTTMTGRADIYVGFLQAGLEMLRPDGVLSFICADRWMRNQYGRLLRQLVEARFSIDAVIEMHDVDAFDNEVSAYPSVITIRNRKQQTPVIADTKGLFNERSAKTLAAWHRKAQLGDEVQTPTFRAAVLPGWFTAQGSWPTGSPRRLSILHDLESHFPLLEDETTGTRVGIGVATGADRVFVTKDSSAAERDRMLPLAMASDTLQGSLDWSGHYLVNPWRSDGEGLVDLADFPVLHDYYKEHIDQLKARNIATRRPLDWFRTIDRVHPSLLTEQKLLLPDIKAQIHPVLDPGTTYPHHNLYFVTSRAWDLEVLGGLLLSRVAQMFIEAYAVRMRGGYLRFQAQYLRRIRVPVLADLDMRSSDALRIAFRERDIEAATNIGLRLYGLSELPD